MQTNMFFPKLQSVSSLEASAMRGCKSGRTGQTEALVKSKNGGEESLFLEWRYCENTSCHAGQETSCGGREKRQPR